MNIKNGIFNKVIDFIKKLFFINKKKLLNEGKSTYIPRKELKEKTVDTFREQIIIPKDTERERLLILRDQKLSFKFTMMKPQK